MDWWICTGDGSPIQEEYIHLSIRIKKGAVGEHKYMSATRFVDGRERNIEIPPISALALVCGLEESR